MVKLAESVLYYHPGTADDRKTVALMKSVLVRMGVRIRNISPDQVMEQVGYLAGVPGFEAQKEGASGEALPVIPEQVMVLKSFSGRRLDELLMNLRKAGVPKIELKAVLTEHNCGWSFYHLYEELKSEHETITAGKEQ